MSSHIVIRPANADDVSSIAAVHVAAWNEAYRHLMRLETLARYDVAARGIMWQRAIDQEAPIQVAEEDGLVVGFALAEANEVQVLYVHPAWWNIGLGTRLLAHLWARVAAEGHETGFLWTLADNIPARRFYERNGGAPGGTRKVRVGDQVLDEVLYSWNLAADPA